MLPWIIIFTVIVAFAIDWFFKRNYSQIDKCFPGPPTLPILGNGILLMKNRKAFHEFGYNICYKYRRSFRLWIGPLPVVVIISPKQAEIILSSTDHTQKSRLYDHLVPWIGRGLLTSYGNKWKSRRRLLTPAFHFQILESFLETFDRNGAIFCQKLKEKTNEKCFDVYELVKLFALDNICETSMGTTIDAQRNAESSYVQSIKRMCDLTFTKMISPWLLIEPIFKLSSLFKVQEKALSEIHGFTKSVIEKRMEDFKNDKDATNDIDNGLNIKRKQVFLDTLLKASKENSLTLQDLQEETDTFMFEGHDTITSAISFLMYNLANYPEYQAKAYQEQLDIFGDSDRTATNQDLQSMRYLEMCIKEALRLYPSVPMIARYVTEDIVLDPLTTIPKNTDVIVLIKAMHQWSESWERPEEYYPDHFLPEEAAKRHPYQYVPFSAGPRNCIGLRFAMLELKSIFSKILRKFELLPATPQVPLDLQVDLILTSKTGVHIAIKERNQ